MTDPRVYDWWVEVVADDADTLRDEPTGLDVVRLMQFPLLNSLSIRSVGYLQGDILVMEPNESRPAIRDSSNERIATLLLVTFDPPRSPSQAVKRWLYTHYDDLPHTVVAMRLPAVLDEAGMNAMLEWRFRHAGPKGRSPRAFYTAHGVATRDARRATRGCGIPYVSTPAVNTVSASRSRGAAGCTTRLTSCRTC
jgi:hypothetical protein